MTRFKYFLEPEKFARILDGEHECDICHQRRKCFDGGFNREEERRNAFCFDCVAKGRLLEVDASFVEGDFEALKEQIQSENPNASADEIEKRAREITKQLEGSTPALTTWQDWFWPAHCGDYCQFIKLAGQDEFNKLAADGNGKALFIDSLYDRDTPNKDLIWSRLKPDSVGPDDNWSPMAYIFKCLKRGAIVTIYDFD